MPTSTRSKSYAPIHQSSFQQGNTPLHLCKTPELANMLLGNEADPYRLANNDGKTAFEIQSQEIRAAIDKFKLFCDRFEFLSLSTPEHATATSVMTRTLARSRTGMCIRTRVSQ